MINAAVLSLHSVLPSNSLFDACDAYCVIFISSDAAIGLYDCSAASNNS